MTEHFSFFDAIQDSNGHYDREYNAQQFTDYFKSLVTTGVMKGAYNQLEVTANGSNMTSFVKSGIAFVEGRYYYNDALLELTHDTEVIGLSRIDRVVVRMDLSTDARHVKTFIKKGVPAASPVPPILTQTQQLYEISLAQVRVVGGQTYITANAVTDERGKDVICPWAGSNILPSYNDNLLATHISDDSLHISPLENTITAVLGTGWAFAGGIMPELIYYKDKFGKVYIQGVVDCVGTGSGIVFTLPVGYRPKRYEIFDGVHSNGSTFKNFQVVIYPDGRVSVAQEVGSTIRFHLSFRA